MYVCKKKHLYSNQSIKSGSYSNITMRSTKIRKEKVRRRKLFLYEVSQNYQKEFLTTLTHNDNGSKF